MRLLSAVVLSLALLPLSVAARGVEEIKNPVIALNTKASHAQVKKAVKLAVLGKGWQISNEKGSSFDAAYSRTGRGGTTGAKIHVTYDTKQVKVKYVSSEGLDAKDGKIHPTYNRWMSFLEKDIPTFVEREVTASE